ncbi:SMI1/KNR4 family protein [Bacillus marinisedimentorum]|uniref:SMI1/KNR4 family protein n=1 Tax=Bacillus marinisedimentorum TaxID=1821260 RepID=UPI0007DE6E13|nr:SMI1/KNR4 family protein [Bacillus marinisedimentorum]
MYEVELKNLIKNKSVHKLSGTSEEKVREIENTLNTNLPDSYKWLLKNYSSVSFEGLDIDGIGLDDVHISLDNTLDWKEYDIPDGYVVIFKPGADWIYCLDTKQMENGECPVVAWYQGEHKGEQEAENLYDFIKDQLELTE